MDIFASALRRVARGLRLLGSAARSLREIAVGGAAYAGLLVRSRNLHIAFALTAAFWLAAWLTEFNQLYLAMNLIIIAVEVLVMFAYLPAFLLAVITWPPNERGQLVMGIWVAWAFDLLTRLWSLVWRFNERPDWMLTSDLLTFLLFGRMLGAVLHVTAPTVADGRIATTSWLRLGAAFFAGVGTAVALILLSSGGRVPAF